MVDFQNGGHLVSARRHCKGSIVTINLPVEQLRELYGREHFHCFTKLCLFSWFSGLALAFHDGSIQIHHRLSLHFMGIYYSSSSSGPRPGDEATLKRQRTSGPFLHFKALQFSWTSLALVGIDNYGKVSSVMLDSGDSFSYVKSNWHFSVTHIHMQ